MFLSLDADRRWSVPAARAAFGLPYRWARMRFRAIRAGAGHYAARLRGPGRRAQPASRSGSATPWPTGRSSGS